MEKDGLYSWSSTLTSLLTSGPRRRRSPARPPRGLNVRSLRRFGKPTAPSRPSAKRPIADFFTALQHMQLLSIITIDHNGFARRMQVIIATTNVPSFSSLLDMCVLIDGL
ncbi:hypothetical protein ANANG_G00146200 [Anguilla anguilla]|uniref:Uncharacterized protein n=1 Tax=Anguilla anguilla TaxID=7936 RepID=A0A9D3RWE4_ANGAN|nr:hypothetical protein ANANG_G00146200 [Anguilla anguilla]